MNIETRVEGALRKRIAALAEGACPTVAETVTALRGLFLNHETVEGCERDRDVYVCLPGADADKPQEFEVRLFDTEIVVVTRLTVPQAEASAESFARLAAETWGAR